MIDLRAGATPKEKPDSTSSVSICSISIDRFGVEPIKMGSGEEEAKK
tara:strand:- start:1156 stop:1296 length:141 start_codon:yes stop_codon:yes gene_type:complete